MSDVIDFKKRNAERAEELFRKSDEYQDKLDQEIKRFKMKQKNGCHGTENDFERITEALIGLKTAEELDDEGIKYMEKSKRQ